MEAFQIIIYTPGEFLSDFLIGEACLIAFSLNEKFCFVQTFNLRKKIEMLRNSIFVPGPDIILGMHKSRRVIIPSIYIWNGFFFLTYTNKSVAIRADEDQRAWISAWIKLI